MVSSAARDLGHQPARVGDRSAGEPSVEGTITGRRRRNSMRRQGFPE